MASYVKVAILGTLVGSEVWSVNICYDPSFEFPGTVNQSALDAATQSIANLVLPSGLLATLSSQAIRTGARVEVREQTNDALIGISTAQSGTPQGGSSSLDKPVQSAVVISLRTNTPGGSGRGRLYWPALTGSLEQTGRLNATVQSNLIAGAKTYLTAIRDILATNFPTIGFDLAVRSKTTKTTPHVVRLQVGNVIDTQRRRRDALPEAYVTTSFP